MRRGCLALGVVLAAACTSAGAEQATEVIEPTTSTAPVVDASTSSTPQFVGEPVSIMAFGDSITEAPQYRSALVDRLDAAGCAFDMVGSRNRFADEVADADHEGYARWSALELSDIARARADDANPDIVIVHAGTNDLAGGVEPAVVIDRIETIVGELRSGAPGVSIVVAQIIPYAADRGEVEVFNGLVADFVRRASEADEHLVVANAFDGFDVETHTRDGIHPNETGGERLAAVFFDALRSLDTPCAG